MTPEETYSAEAEQSLLGALMINNEVMRLVESRVEPEHFYDLVHQQIFWAISMLIRMGRVANPVTMWPLLPESIGDMPVKKYLAMLCANATTIVNAPDYAQVVRDFADRRALTAILSESVPHVADDPADAANNAIDRLSVLVSARDRNDSGAVDMGKAVTKAVDAAAEAYKRDGGMIGMPYGLRDLDHKLGGAQDGDLIIIAGRPSMGKSALAISIARNMAIGGHPGMFYSAEMPDVQLVHRMTSDHLYETRERVAYNELRRGTFAESKFQSILDASADISQWPIQIEQEGGLTIGQVAARARVWRRKKGLRWLVVDYIQLLQASDRYRGNRVNEVSEITQGLKLLAKELKIPVIALSQLSRGVDARDDKRPLMSDLRDSGSIEQDADVVMFVYREGYYLQNREPKPATPEHEIWQNAMEAAWNRVDVIVGKNRMGPIGTVQLFCDIGHNAFRSLHDGGRGYLPSSDGGVLL